MGTCCPISQDPPSWFFCGVYFEQQLWDGFKCRYFLCRYMVIETISLVDQVLFPPSAQLYPRTHVNMTWATQEGDERGSTCLVSKSNDFNCSWVLENEPTYSNLISGESLIVVNFTVTNVKDDTSSQKFLPRSAKPSMIKVWPWLNFWPGTDVWFETDPRLEANPWPRNAFLLFHNVHLRATLSITARQTMANGYFAAFGRQKPRCDAQNSPMPLTVCSASKFVIFQYRQSVSRPRPTHYG